MNQSFEDLASELATASTPPPWGATPLPIAAAYHSLKERQKKMHKPTTDYSELVLAGVHACTLATFVLNTEYPDEAEGRMMRKCAHLVLGAWGMGIQGLPKEDPIKEPAAPPAPQHLVWPPFDRLGRPLTTALPDVYRENHYHVHENTVVSNGLSGQLVLPEEALALHDAYWSEEALQWRMRFSLPSLPNLEKFWLSHSQVKPGREIPKVIDAATQARSNDP